MSDRATPIWPFPGQPQAPWWECYPPHNLPPPRFAVGDRVVTRWGHATVLKVHDWEHFDGRGYHLRLDGTDAPPGFGKTWSEAGMQPAGPPARWEHEEDPIDQAQAAGSVAQLVLFA